MARRRQDKDRRRKRRNRCRSGKTRFRSQSEAIHSLHRFQKTSVREVVPKRVYQCEFCNGWHLTSEDARSLGFQPG